MKPRWDIFCAVVDNFGDIGICWRLARQLSIDHAQQVRLWVDDLASFARIQPGVDPAAKVQTLDEVEIRQWPEIFPPVEPAQIVIEGFGVRLPETYLDAMAAMQPPPVWINFEHISAESWVDGCHGLPSPHPRLPLTKYFFFPGFTPQTGGLLIEKNFRAARDEFQANASMRAGFLRALGAVPQPGSLCISLFCYENAALDGLVAAWSRSAKPIVCYVAAGRGLAAVNEVVGRLETGGVTTRGVLTLVGLPFMPVDDYDRLLWACDVNFVRGEDSFVRAQFAAEPLVWQAYVQDDDAHLVKEKAFLDRYLSGPDAATAAAWRALNEAWNRELPATGAAWDRFAGRLGEASTHARDWAGRLLAGPRVADKLAEFCLNRLK